MLELTECALHLDRVCPDGERRVDHPPGAEPVGEAVQVAGGSVDVAECDLEMSEYTKRGDREEVLRRRLREPEAFGSRGASIVDQTEVGLDQRPCPSDPRAAARMSGLLRQLVRGTGVVEGLRPTAGRPLEHAQGPEDHHAGAFVASFDRLRLQFLEQRPRSVDLAESEEESGVCVPWALVGFECQPEALFQFHPPLDQPRRHLDGVGLSLARSRDRHREQERIAGPLRLLEGCICVDQRPAGVALIEVDPHAPRKDPRRTCIVPRRLGQGLLVEFGQRRRVGSLRHHEPEEDIGPLDAVRHLTQ